MEKRDYDVTTHAAEHKREEFAPGRIIRRRQCRADNIGDGKTRRADVLGCDVVETMIIIY